MRTVVVQTSDDEPLTEQRRVDARHPGFATVVDLDHEPGARSSDALSEVVARTPGATVRSLGGLGQFSAVSIRGSTPQQVGVFLDGVPLGSSLAGLVDLSDLPLDGLSALTIHRGYVPVAYGGATIGGAIDLVTRVSTREPRLYVRGGLGSFGARETGAAVTAPLGSRFSISSRVGYAGARGDFEFFDDAGTPANPADDRTSIRRNNGYDRVLAQLRADGRVGRWNLGVGELVVWKRQGLAGRGRAQARRSRLQSVVARTGLQLERPDTFGPGGHLGWVVGLGLRHQHYLDPDNEIGIGMDDQRVGALDLYVSPRLRIPAWTGATVGLVADGRTEWIQVDERIGAGPASGDALRSRHGFGAGVELEQRLVDDRIVLVPAARVDAFASRFAVPSGRGEPNDAGRDAWDLGFSPRIGTRVLIVPGLELRASAGRYFRVPTSMELFGDQGYVIGNEGLVPERGTAVDGGLLVDFGADRFTFYAQASGFATWSSDLIQWVSAGLVTRPENLSNALVRGVESSLVVAPSSRRIELQANYTFLDSENRGDELSTRGRPLPGRPRHEAFGRVSVGNRWFVRGTGVEPRAFTTLEYIAGTFLDPSGRYALPARSLLGLGTQVQVGPGLRIAAEVRNLLDVRTANVVFPVGDRRPISTALSDFIGYPLPGRSFWISLEIIASLRRRPAL